jgi:two-component system cell cycle sensor histidine kinase/response regulator CckA
MCYGIISQHGGNISVKSTVGHGATFQILLPRVEATAASVSPRDDRPLLPRGSEGVLVAEDEPAVRALAVRILRQQGYRVLEATNGEDALRVARERLDETIALLLTDLVMPQMGGATLAEQIVLLHPSIKVLFMSGYSDTAIVQSGPDQGGVAFLHKPFSPAALAGKVREVLDS